MEYTENEIDLCNKVIGDFVKANKIECSDDVVSIELIEYACAAYDAVPSHDLYGSVYNGVAARWADAREAERNREDVDKLLGAVKK